MEQTTVRYGLAMNDKLLGFHIESNEGAEFCFPVQYVLDEDESTPWLVDTLQMAEAASRVSTEWFNARYERPTNPYVGKCRVVKVTMTVQEDNL